jgi:aerobic-type carbon monoxide dehydrogenase small subunit (CoxS/CutS family)
LLWDGEPTRIEASGGESVKEFIELQINGARHRVETEPERSLLSVLRDELDLTGAKYGCGEGQCGACTVLVDGVPSRSCLLRLRAAAGREIVTIEGLEKEGRLNPIQEAFLEAGAFQCGYCTPGMILSTVGLLKKNPKPTEAEARRYLEGNLCRCGTYPRILDAVARAARALGEGGR